MAGNDNQQITDLLEKLKRSQQEQERASTKLSKAMDDLSRTSVDVLMKNMKDAAKQAGLLSEEQLSLIKTHKELNNAIEHQEKLAEKAAQIQAAYNKEMDEALKLQKTTTYAGKIAADEANDKYKKDLELLNLEEDQCKQLLASNKAFKEATDKQVEAAESMDHFMKHMDSASSAISSWAKKTFSFSNAIDLIKQGVVGSLEDLNKVTAVGLQGSFVTIQEKAVSLWMSFDEFSEVISKNRDVLRQFGGGADSVVKFSDLLAKASIPLNYMGKEGTKATSRFFDTLKASGVTVSSSGTIFMDTMAQTQKEFKKYSALYGDNADEFASLIESQLKGASTQLMLLSLGNINRAKMREEIMIRTDNLKQLGLSNEQIKDFNTSLENIYDPTKNNQEQKIQEGAMAQAFAQQLAQMNPEDKELQAALPTIMKYFDMQMQNATPKQMEDFATANAKSMQELVKAQGLATQKQGEMFAGKRPGSALTTQMTSNQFLEGGGASLKGLLDFLTHGAVAHMEGRDKFGTATPGGANEKQQAVNAQSDELPKVITDARNLMQQAEAVQNNNMVKLIEGLGLAGLLGASTLLTGKFGAMTKIVETFGGALSGVSTWVAKAMSAKGLIPAAEGALAKGATAAPLGAGAGVVGGVVAPAAVILAAGALAMNTIDKQGENSKAVKDAQTNYFSGPDIFGTTNSILAKQNSSTINSPGANDIVKLKEPEVSTTSTQATTTQAAPEVVEGKRVVGTSGNPVVDELKTQTELLTKIEANTKSRGSQSITDGHKVTQGAVKTGG